MLIEHVPTGVCRECGTRYYSANVLKTIAENIRNRNKAKRHISVPVFSL
ncbi:YgiT-type zinc finger protein [candidate division KSB1 bacterium]|nr:YgiT-type zinc finger protein [candidate division KSB1 bacterium]